MPVKKGTKMEEYDVIVVGGGPSGSGCAIFLARAGKTVLLLDRAKFPRDKVCGDAMYGRHLLNLLRDLGVLKETQKAEHENIYGIIVSSPNSTTVPIIPKNAKPNNIENSTAVGFVCRRFIFDNLLFQSAKKQATKTIEEFFVSDLIMESGRPVGVKGRHRGKSMEFRANVIVGADGASGITARRLGAHNNDGAHQGVGVRAYYENVGGMEGKIEIHHVKESAPGYFWIFPLPGGKANVGIGMLVKDMKKKKADLSKKLEETITDNPLFKKRFKNAKRISDIKTWFLPLASNKVKRYGNGYVLIGDAASLVEPFTAEGIRNGLISAKIASQVITGAFEENDFSEKKFSQYQTRLFDIIGNDVSVDYKLQQIASNEFLFNLLTAKAKKSKATRRVVSEAIFNLNNRKNLTDPKFIIKALLA